MDLLTESIVGLQIEEQAKLNHYERQIQQMGLGACTLVPDGAIAALTGQGGKTATERRLDAIEDKLDALADMMAIILEKGEEG